LATAVAFRAPRAFRDEAPYWKHEPYLVQAPSVRPVDHIERDGKNLSVVAQQSKPQEIAQRFQSFEKEQHKAIKLYPGQHKALLRVT
jgi:hypothetical protein